MSFFRRSGAEIMRLIKILSDPSAVSGTAQIYAKDNGGGIVKPYAQWDDGTVVEIGSGGGGGGDFATSIRVATAFGGNFATVHDWSPPGFTSSVNVIIIESQDGGTQGIGGLTGGVDGRIVTIMKVANAAPGYPGNVPAAYGQGLFFVTEDAGSIPANRFAANWGNNSFGNRPSAFTARYDGTISRWVPIFFQVNNT